MYFDANKDDHLESAVTGFTVPMLIIPLDSGSFAPSTTTSVICEGGVCD